MFGTVPVSAAALPFGFNMCIRMISTSEGSRKSHIYYSQKPCLSWSNQFKFTAPTAVHCKLLSADFYLSTWATLCACCDDDEWHVGAVWTLLLFESPADCISFSVTAMLASLLTQQRFVCDNMHSKIYILTSNGCETKVVGVLAMLTGLPTTTPRRILFIFSSTESICSAVDRSR